MLDFDDNRSWGPTLTAALRGLLTDGVLYKLVTASPQYVEDASELLFSCADRTRQHPQMDRGMEPPAHLLCLGRHPKRRPCRPQPDPQGHQNRPHAPRTRQSGLERHAHPRPRRRAPRNRRPTDQLNKTPPHATLLASRPNRPPSASEYLPFLTAANIRRSSVRRTPGSSSGWRRISSSNTPTGRMAGLKDRHDILLEDIGQRAADPAASSPGMAADRRQDGSRWLG